MATIDLFNGLGADGVNKVKGSALTTSPNFGYMDAVDAAVDVPSVTYKALGAKVLDTLDGSDELDPNELEQMYPNVPKGFFQNPTTERMADWLVDRYESEDVFNNVQKFREYNSSGFLKKIGDLGLNIVKETSPTDIAVGIAGGYAVGGLLAFGGMASGSAAVNGVAKYLSSEYLGAIAAKELIEAALTAPIDYGIRKGLEKDTGIEATWQDSVYGALGGAAITTAGRFAVKGLRGILQGKKVEAKVSPEAASAYGDAMDEYLKSKLYLGYNEPPVVLPRRALPFNGPTGGGEVFETTARTIKYGAETTVMASVNSLDPYTKGLYKVFSHADSLPDDAQPNTLYALFNSASPKQHNAITTPFGGSVILTTASKDLRAYSAAFKQGGQIVAIDTTNLKIADLDALDGEDFATVQNILKDFGFDQDNFGEAFGAMRVSEASEVVEGTITEYLQSKGYQGIAFTEINDILDRTFARKHTFLFDGIEGLERRTVDMLDGSLGGLPESVTMYNTTKKVDLLFGEGVLSNGKKVTYDPNGYFNTDPHWANPESIVAYTNYFDAKHVAEINKAVEAGSLEGIRTKYKELNESTLDYLNQLKIYEELDMKERITSELEDTFKYPSVLESLKVNGELDKLIKKVVKPSDQEIFKDIVNEYIDSANKQVELNAERKLVESAIVEKINKEAIKDIISKSLSKLAKEGKADRILEDAEIEKVTQDFVKRLESALANNKLDRAYSLTALYEDFIEQLKTANPDITDEIVKAADFCLRKNTL